VAIGGETIRDASLNIADILSERSYVLDSFDMILGTDFLRAHRVYISRYQLKVYFSYTGGKVFPTPKGRDCGERERP